MLAQAVSPCHSAFQTESGEGSRYSRMPPKVTASLPARQQESEQGDGRPILPAERAEFRHALGAMNLFIAFVPLISCAPMR